jgi:hypothetical protein
MAQAAHRLTTSETRKLAVLMRMALTYADAAGAEPDAVKRSELLDLSMTCWRQARKCCGKRKCFAAGQVSQGGPDRPHRCSPATCMT